MFGIDDALNFGSSLIGLFGHGDQKNLLKSQKKLTDASTTAMQQEEAGKQSTINQLAGPGGAASFYDPYMSSGSPFLKQQQRASSETINKGYDQALGQSRLQASQAGFGYAPSGIQAGIESSLGRDRARSTSEAYLNNLLQNEQVKFQAAGAKSDVLGKAASLYNPAAFAGPANTSNAQAYGMANQNPSTLSTVLGAGSNLLGSFLKKKTTSPTFTPGAGGGTGQSGGYTDPMTRIRTP